MGGIGVRAARLGRMSLIAIVLGGVLLGSTACGGNERPRTEAVAAVETTSPSPTAKPKKAATPTPTPVTAVAEERVVEAVAFESSRVDDGGMPSGQTAVGTAGVAGERTIIYRVTRVDGVETAREEISNAITRAPVTEVIRVGTYVAPPPPPQPEPAAPAAPAPPAAPASGGCDSNYTGACVPISSDVDCEGGSGNGPAYVRGPVTVVGSDVYGLDNDGDGTGCES